MKQFDVFANPDPLTRGYARWLTVISSHHLPLATVMVAPLLARPVGAKDVEIAVSFDGIEHILSLMLMTALPAARLRGRVGDLAAFEEAIRRGLDRLFTGF